METGQFGAVWVYPPPAQVVLAGNPEDIGKRVFASNTLSKTFCRTCGVPMTNQNLVFTSEMGLQTRAEGRGGVTRYETHPVNIRVLDNERLDLSKLDIIKAEGSKFLPAYVNP